MMAGNARPFMDFLREHRGGRTHDELSDALNELVAAVTLEERGGSLTLTLSIKPLAEGDGVEVSAAIKAKPPEKLPGTSIFFVTPENNLVRTDPRQVDMELRRVPPASAAKSLA